MSASGHGELRPEGDDWEPNLGSLLVGIAVGVVTLGAVWLLVGLVTEDEKAESPDASEPSAAVHDSSETTSQSPSSTRLERCTAAAAVVEHPLQQSRPALDQWEVHVGAMNKLMVGAITLQQATAFWNQTRVGAYDWIGRFEDAEAHLERRGVDCPAPRLLGSGASPALRTCAQHVAAELRALDSARTAITTWKHHVHAMDQLRAGNLSPAAATRMWLRMWQRGVDELEQFREAARVARHTAGCGGTVTGESGPSPTSPTESPMSGMDMP